MLLAGTVIYQSKTISNVSPGAIMKEFDDLSLDFMSQAGGNRDLCGV